MVPVTIESQTTLRAMVLDAEAGFSAIEAEWHRLASDVPGATCFMQPTYFDTWRRILADDVDTRLIAVYDGDALCGVLPIMQGLVWRGPSCSPRVDYAPSDRYLSPGRMPRPFPVRQISSVVSWQAAALRPTLLCRPQDTAAVAGAVASAMAGLSKWDAIVLPIHEGDEERQWVAAFRGLGLRPWVHRLGRVVMTLERVRPFDAILAEQSRNFRRNIKRAREGASRLGVTCTMHEGQAEVGRHLETIARIARASWKHTGNEGARISVTYEGRQRQFFEALLGRENADLTPVLGIASLQGDPIAVALSLRHAAAVTGLLLFWNERYPDASPGHLLMGQLIEWAADRRLTRVDLNATQPWLRHFADTRRTLANIIVFAPTLVGRTYGVISQLAQVRHKRSRS